MKLVDRFINWLISRAKRTPYFHLDGYMNRYWPVKPNNVKEPGEKKRWFFGGVGIRIHQILRSDFDDCFHDHPFSSISIVLRGGYMEYMPLEANQHIDLDPHCRKKEWRKPGAIVFRKAKDRHLLELPKGQECWSIFIMGKKQDSWGFYPSSGFVHYRKYLGIPEGSKKPGAGESMKAR